MYKKVKNIGINFTFEPDAQGIRDWENLLGSLVRGFEARNVKSPVDMRLHVAGSSGILELFADKERMGRVGIGIQGEGESVSFQVGPKIVRRNAYALDAEQIGKHSYKVAAGPEMPAADVLSDKILNAMYSSNRSMAGFGKALRSSLDRFENIDPFPAVAKRYSYEMAGSLPTDPQVTGTAYAAYVERTLQMAKERNWSPEYTAQMLSLPSQASVGSITAPEVLAQKYPTASGYSLQDTAAVFGTVLGQEAGEPVVYSAIKPKNVAKRVEDLANIPMEVEGFPRATGYFQTGPVPLSGQVMTHVVMPGAILGAGEAALNFERFRGRSGSYPWSTRSHLAPDTLLRLGTFEPGAWREDPAQAYISYRKTRLGPSGDKTLEVSGYMLEYPTDWPEKWVQAHREKLHTRYQEVSTQADDPNLVDPMTLPYTYGRGSLTGEPVVIARGRRYIPDLLSTTIGEKETGIKALGKYQRIGTGEIDPSGSGPQPQFSVLGVQSAPDWVMSPKNQLKSEPSYVLQGLTSLPRKYLDWLFSNAKIMGKYGITPEEVAEIRSSPSYQATGQYMSPELVHKLVNLGVDYVFDKPWSPRRPWGRIKAQQLIPVSPGLRAGIGNLLAEGVLAGEFVQRGGRDYFFGTSDAWILPKITTVRDLYAGQLGSQTVASAQSSALVTRNRFRNAPADERAWAMYRAAMGGVQAVPAERLRKEFAVGTLSDEDLAAFMRMGPYADKYIDIGGMILEPGKGALEVLESGEMSAYGSAWIRSFREAMTTPVGMGPAREMAELRTLRHTLMGTEDFIQRLGQRRGIARHITAKATMGGWGDVHFGTDVLQRATGIQDPWRLEIAEALLGQEAAMALGGRAPITELLKSLGVRVRSMHDLYPDDPELGDALRNQVAVPAEFMNYGWGDFDADIVAFEMQSRFKGDRWQGPGISNDLSPEKLYQFLAQFTSGETRERLLAQDPSILGKAIEESGYTELSKMFADIREGTGENFLATARAGLHRVPYREWAAKYQQRALGKSVMGFGFTPEESIKQRFQREEIAKLGPNPSPGALRQAEAHASARAESFLGMYQNLLDVAPFRGKVLTALAQGYQKWARYSGQPPSMYWTGGLDLRIPNFKKEIIGTGDEIGAYFKSPEAFEFAAGHTAAAWGFMEMVASEAHHPSLAGSIPIPAEAIAELFNADPERLRQIAKGLQSPDKEVYEKAKAENFAYWQEHLTQIGTADIPLADFVINPFTRSLAGKGEHALQIPYMALSRAMAKPYLEMLRKTKSEGLPGYEHAYKTGSLQESLYDQIQRVASSPSNLENDPRKMFRSLGRMLFPERQDSTKLAWTLYQKALRSHGEDASTAYGIAMLHQSGFQGLPPGARLAQALRGDDPETAYIRKATQAYKEGAMFGGLGGVSAEHLAPFVSLPPLPETREEIASWAGTPFHESLHRLAREAGTPGLIGQAAINEQKYIRSQILQRLVYDLPEEQQQKYMALFGINPMGESAVSRAGFQIDAAMQEGVNRAKGTVYALSYPGPSNVYDRAPGSVENFLMEFSTGRRGIKREALEQWYGSLPEGDRATLRSGILSRVPGMKGDFESWEASVPPMMPESAYHASYEELHATDPLARTAKEWTKPALISLRGRSKEDTLASDLPRLRNVASYPAGRYYHFDPIVGPPESLPKSTLHPHDPWLIALPGGEMYSLEGRSPQEIMEHFRKHRVVMKEPTLAELYARVTPETRKAFEEHFGNIGQLFEKQGYFPKEMKPARKFSSGNLRNMALLDKTRWFHFGKAPTTWDEASESGFMFQPEKKRLVSFDTGATVNVPDPEGDWKPVFEALAHENATMGESALGDLYQHMGPEGKKLLEQRFGPASELFPTSPLGGNIDLDRLSGPGAADYARWLRERWGVDVNTLGYNVKEPAPLPDALNEEGIARWKQTAGIVTPYILEAAHMRARQISAEDPHAYAWNFLSSLHSMVGRLKRQGSKGAGLAGIPAFGDIRDLGEYVTSAGKDEIFQKLAAETGFSSKVIRDILGVGYGGATRSALTIQADDVAQAAGFIKQGALQDPRIAAAMEKYGLAAMTSGRTGIFPIDDDVVKVEIKNWDEGADPLAAAVARATGAAQAALGASPGVTSGPGTTPPGGAVPPRGPGTAPPGAPGGAVPPGGGAAVALAAGAYPGGAQGQLPDTMLGNLGYLLFNVRRISWLTMESVKRSMETYAAVEQRATQIEASLSGAIDETAPGFRIWATKAGFKRAGLAFGEQAYRIWGSAYSQETAGGLESIAGSFLGGATAAVLPALGMSQIAAMIGKVMMQRTGPGQAFYGMEGLIKGSVMAGQYIPAAIALESYRNYLTTEDLSPGNILAGTGLGMASTAFLGGTLAKTLAQSAPLLSKAVPWVAGAYMLYQAGTGISAAVRAAKERREVYGEAPLPEWELGAIAAGQYQILDSPLRSSQPAPTAATAHYRDILKAVKAPYWYDPDRALELTGAFAGSGIDLRETGGAALFNAAAKFAFRTGMNEEQTVKAAMSYLSALSMAPWSAGAADVMQRFYDIPGSQELEKRTFLAQAFTPVLQRFGATGIRADAMLQALQNRYPDMGPREASILADKLSYTTQYQWARMFPEKAFVDVETGLQLGQQEIWGQTNFLRELTQFRERQAVQFQMQHEIPRIRREAEKSLVALDLGIVGRRLDISGQQLGIAQQEFGLRWAGAELGFAERRLGLSQREAILGHQWAREDLALSWQEFGLGAAWGAEDYGEARKYTRGRERRELDRQYRRSLVKMGLEAEKLTRQEEREGIQFGMRMEGLGIQSEELQMQKDKLAEQLPLMREQLQLSRERLKLSQDQLALEEKYLDDEKAYIKASTDEREAQIRHLNLITPLQQKLADLSAEVEQRNTANIAIWQKAVQELSQTLRDEGLGWILDTVNQRYQETLQQAGPGADEKKYGLPYLAPTASSGVNQITVNVTITGLTAEEQAQRLSEVLEATIQNAF